MKKLFKKLTEKFSEFIRLRDADDDGICICPLCDKSGKWIYFHCAHYIKCRHGALRWHERNCHAQCPECNCDQYTDGQFAKYQDFMTKKYTPGEIGELHMLKNSDFRPTKYELQIKIDHYTELVKELKKEKS